MYPPGQLTWQPSLLDSAQEVALTGPSSITDLAGNIRRHLNKGAWVDHAASWLKPSDCVFGQLLSDAPWHSEPDRVMYDSVVAVPRLTTGPWVRGRPPILDEMAAGLSRHYGIDLVSISANLYRDGNDSVAWHGDQVGTHRTSTVVAILSLGSTRSLLLRPDGGGQSISYTLRSGDLLVMGGSCQRTYEHCVPKRARSGPRISVMFRELNGH